MSAQPPTKEELAKVQAYLISDEEAFVRFFNGLQENLAALRQDLIDQGVEIDR